jgi:uracil-DNA glycosylase
MAVDGRKSLARMWEQWGDCTRCSLGEIRSAEGKPVVAGTGAKGKILVVLRSPTWKTEEGIPTDGEEFLYALIRAYDAMEHIYVTYTTACRSCSPIIDEDTGQQKMRSTRRGLVPMYRDIPPSHEQRKACSDRLLEEVYLVDPVIVLACGDVAIQSLMGKAVSTASLVGNPTHFTVPGAGIRPRVTEKRQVWGRKFQGQMIYPTEPAPVSYLMIPTYEPEIALKATADHRPTSPAVQLKEHVREAVNLYTHSLDLTRDDKIETPEPMYDDAEDLDV